MARNKGRPRGSPANHHLFLENGGWIFRWARNGRDVRRSTGCPKSEAARARTIRDKWIGEFSARRHGVEEIPPAVTLRELVRLYLEAESKPNDRERGGSQPGAKRSADGDRGSERRLKKHLDFDLSADLIDKERLLDAGASMAEPFGDPARTLAPFTIRNSFRFLRRVYGWGRANKRKTGILSNPFDELEATERRRVFPGGVAKKAPPFTREQLRALYDRLPAHGFRPVRFAAHTGMRWHSELMRMEWGRVDLARRVYVVDPRWAKGGKEREVPLGDVALEILRQIRPASPKPEDPVWLNSEGRPLADLRDVFKRRVKKVCPEPGAGKRRPDLHSLRRTCATALDKVAPRSVLRAILGHGPREVTDLYVSVSLEDQLVALNRAALLIDGEPKENVVPFAAAGAEMAVRMGVGSGA